MEEAGWNVQIMSNVKSLRKKIVEINVLVGTGFLLSFLLLMLFQQRRQRLAELKRMEVQARKALQEANEQLETRVNERTSN